MGWGGRGTYFLIIFYDNKTWNLCQRFCQKDPVLPAGSHRGGLSSGLTWVGWAEGEGSVVGSEGRLRGACAPAGPLENLGSGPGWAISTLQEFSCCPVSVLPSSHEQHPAGMEPWHSKVWLTGAPIPA